MRVRLWRPRLLWQQFRKSTSSVGPLVLYIQIFTGVLILGSVVSIQTISWIAGLELKNKFREVLHEEDQVAYLTARLGKISRIKEDFLLNLDSNQISTRDMLADLQSELTTLSSDVRNSTPVSGKKDLPLLIVKEFDSAYLRILRTERVVSSALKANRVLTRDDGVTLLRQYPLSDLRLVQRNLIDSYTDLNLLALEVESELEESDEFYMLILLFAVFGASAIAILSSYRVYRHSIVIPLESISSIASGIPIIDGRGINGAADHLDSLVNTVELLSRPSHAAHEIKTLRHAVAALMSGLVQSFETLNLLSLTDPLCQVEIVGP